MATHEIDRRDFLASSAATATLLSGNVMAWAADQAPNASRLIAGKDPRLIVQGAEPLEIETPLALLRQSNITPASVLFVRNNQSLANSATLRPLSDQGWNVELTGLLGQPASIAVEQLKQMDLVDREVVLQCSGNGRAAFSRAAPTKGAQWQYGAMGNVVFRGVPLAAVIERLKIKVSPEAEFLTAEGKDSPAKMGEADFEHSIPLDDAPQRSLLALDMNGEPIPAVHGGPVRLVTPGYYGTMNIKWLGRLRFEARETDNYHQVRRYRSPRTPIEPGSEFTYGLENSDANWRMRTKCVIFSPLDGETVRAGAVEVRGVAFNDGAAPLESVDVSRDAGRTWQRADLVPNKSPYGWSHFKALAKLPSGKAQIAARAVDRLGRTQPLDGQIHWNPAGYAWNGVHFIEVQVMDS
jgi:sulfite oxidase